MFEARGVNPLCGGTAKNRALSTVAIWLTAKRGSGFLENRNVDIAVNIIATLRKRYFISIDTRKEGYMIFHTQ